MKCPQCGVEMLIYRTGAGKDGTRERAYSCRNRNCPRYDERLRKKEISQAEKKAF